MTRHSRTVIRRFSRLAWFRRRTHSRNRLAAGQSGGAIKADQAAIQAAKVNLNYTKITSPINGVVGLRQVDPGNIVHASDANGLLVVTQLEPITVIFTLPEDHLPEVLDLTRKGKKLTVEAYDRSGTTHLATGSVLTVDNQIDTTTGTVKVKAVFDNKDGALFPNQFVNVRLILEQTAECDRYSRGSDAFRLAGQLRLPGKTR